MLALPITPAGQDESCRWLIAESRKAILMTVQSTQSRSQAYQILDQVLDNRALTGEEAVNFASQFDVDVMSKAECRSLMPIMQGAVESVVSEGQSKLIEAFIARLTARRGDSFSEAKNLVLKSALGPLDSSHGGAYYEGHNPGEIVLEDGYSEADAIALASRLNGAVGTRPENAESLLLDFCQYLDTPLDDRLQYEVVDLDIGRAGGLDWGTWRAFVDLEMREVYWEGAIHS